MHTLIPTRPIALALGLALLLGAGLTRADNKPKKPKNEKKNVEVVNLNILHGINCDPPLPDHGDQCRVRDRIDLLVEHLVAAGCPDIVTLQENVTSEFVQTTATGEIVGPLDDTTALIKERLPDLAEMCDRVGVISRGSMVCVEETRRLIRDRGGRRIRVRACARGDELYGLLKSSARVEGLRWDNDSLIFRMEGAGEEELANMLAEIVRKGIPLVQFSEEEPSLEAAYLNVTRAGEGWEVAS